MNSVPLPTRAVALILVAAVLTLLNIQTRGDVGYTLVIIWALGGIVVKQGFTDADQHGP